MEPFNVKARHLAGYDNKLVKLRFSRDLREKGGIRPEKGVRRVAERVPGDVKHQLQLELLARVSGEPATRVNLDTIWVHDELIGF